MNARVFLLVLVTAAFMAIWDADRPTELRLVVAQSHDAAAMASVGGTRAKASVANDANVATNSVPQKDAALPPANINDEKLIPLPRELPPGTWRAFNHEGDSIRITIERRTIPPHSPISNTTTTLETAANSCVITGSDGVRWCFVKEENATAN